MSKKYNTPQLRFPGFEGEWKEKKLSDVFTRLTKKNTEDNKNILTISAQYGLISQLDFFKTSVSASDVTGYYLLRKGDFAYNKSSSQGRPVGAIKPLKLYDKGVVSTLYICFKCKDPNAIGFWEQYFDASIFDKEIMSIAQEGARNHGLLNVPTKGFFDLTVLEPTPTEQKKIAECLEEIDNLIAAQGKKVDALKEKKKGLMQQLFPQQGETVPRLRFPGFEGEWAGKKMEDVAGFQNGFAYNSVSFSNAGNLVIRISDIQDGVVSLKSAVHSSTNVSDVYKVLKGDILIAMSGATAGKIGEYRNNEVAYINQRVGNIKPFGMNKRLLLFLLQSDLFLHYLNGILTVGAQPNISPQQICSFCFLLPKTVEEQKKIADFLSEMDESITSESAKLDALKDHKKGLMQQLFPQPNE